jgi:hypothetical protein
LAIELESKALMKPPLLSADGPLDNGQASRVVTELRHQSQMSQRPIKHLDLGVIRRP